MPFGHRRIEIGLMLRDAMFVNGILCNSEAWHSISNKNIADLEIMDRMLLRYITNSYAKVQTEFLYLETGTTPLRQVINNRRMMYLQNILKRPQNEILRKVYQSQKENPVDGDWVNYVKNNFEEVGMVFDEEAIMSESKYNYKKEVKTTFEKLKQTQAGHSKISHLCYKSFQTQEYLKSHKLNNHEVSLLFSLRSRTARDFKGNFPFYVNQLCPMGCSEIDTQEHILQCDKVYPENVRDSNISYMDIFSDNIDKQAALAKLFVTLLGGGRTPVLLRLPVAVI